MSYKSYLHSELKYIPETDISPNEIDLLDKCLDYCSQLGAQAGNLYVLRREMDATYKEFQYNMAVELNDFITSTLGDAMKHREFDMSPPVYAALAPIRVDRAAWLVHTLINVVSFTPLAPVEGHDDEWVQHSADTCQNRRLSSLFKDPTTGKVTWLERFSVHYPWYNGQKWHAQYRSGVVGLPFYPKGSTISVYYTDENRRQRVIGSRDAYINNECMRIAAGGPLDTVVSAYTEQTDLDTAVAVRAVTEQLWEAIYTPEDAYAEDIYSKHKALLGQLDYWYEGEPPASITIMGVEVEWVLIPHVQRAISLIPAQVARHDGKWTYYTGDVVDGRFEIIDVYNVDGDYAKWVKNGMVSLRWQDVVSGKPEACLINAAPGYVLLIPGDQEDWLWQQRDKLGIPHPERQCSPSLENNASECADSHPEE